MEMAGGVEGGGGRGKWKMQMKISSCHCIRWASVEAISLVQKSARPDVESIVLP